MKRNLFPTSKISSRLNLSKNPKTNPLIMPQELAILECTEAKAEGKPTSRYVTTRNKKSIRTPNRLEKKKYNPFLKRRTLHREIK